MKNGIGLDWGLKTLLTCSNGFRFSNFNNHADYKKLLEEKEAIRMKHKNDSNARMWALNEHQVKIAKYKSRYFQKIINTLIKQQPKYISYETLIFDDKNEIQKTNYKYFFNMLKRSCILQNIELRIVDPYYPSSKICSRCGKVKNELKLSDRIYKCDYCDLEIDRDLNASINIRESKNFIRVI